MKTKEKREDLVGMFILIIALLASACQPEEGYVPENVDIYAGGDSQESELNSKEPIERRWNCPFVDFFKNGRNYHDFERTEYECRYRDKWSAYEFEVFEISFFKDFTGYLNDERRNFRFVAYSFNPEACVYLVKNYPGGKGEFEMSRPVIDNYGSLQSFIMHPVGRNKAFNVQCDIILGPRN